MTDSYHFEIGRFQCTAINDGDYVGNAGMLFTNAPEDELAAALARHGESADAIPTPWTCLLVRTGTHNLLIDAGTGETIRSGGKLLTSLDHMGFSPEEIDVVILSHVHMDHVLGCLRADGRLTFPNATHVMGKDEWSFWTTGSTLRDAPQWAADTARRVLPSLSDRMKLVEDGESVLPGIRVLSAPGHTFGHVVVEIVSEAEKLLYLADTALHPIHLEHADWTASVDQIPEQAVKTRRAFYERAAQPETLVLFFHFYPFPSLGYILKQGESWRWKPHDRDTALSPGLAG